MPDVIIDFSDNFDNLVLGLKKAGPKILQESMDALAQTANDMRTGIIRDMTASPGDPTRGYKRGRHTHFASFPGAAPRRDTGELISRIVARTKKMVQKLEP